MTTGPAGKRVSDCTTTAAPHRVVSWKLANAHEGSIILLVM